MNSIQADFKNINYKQIFPNSLSLSKIDGKNILPLLKESSLFQKAYLADAGVGEGYSVGEHTQMVLDVAEKFASTLRPQVEPLISWNEFILFLALHDIGKGFSYQEEKNSPFQNSLTFKAKELENTRIIIEDFLNYLNFPKEKIELFKALLMEDTIGNYLKGGIGLREAYHDIIEYSYKSNVKPEQFLSLFSAFHMADAASYPILYRSCFTEEKGWLYRKTTHYKFLSELAKQISLANEGEKILPTLNEMDLKQLKTIYLEKLPALYAFLEKNYIELLIDDGKMQQKDKYHQIKKNYRKLLSILIQNYNIQNARHSFLEKLPLQKYVGSIQQELPSDGSYEQQKELYFFIDELVHFRKDYLIRYSNDKVKNKITENIEIENDLLDQIMDLLKMTWLHGTQASLFTGLPQTDYKLMPTGKLPKDIVVFSGELRRGSIKDGINQTALSGVSLDDPNKAISYSNDSDFHSKKQEIKNTVQKFYNSENKPILNQHCVVGLAEDYTNLSFLLKRLRILDPTFIKRKQDRILPAIEKIKKNWDEYKKSENYKKAMPRRLDCQYGWHDDFWLKIFSETEKAIQSLEESLTTPLASYHEIKEVSSLVNDPFPITFGSTTAHPYSALPNSTQSERCVYQSLKLGKDIQHAFTSSDENKEKLEKILQKFHLSNVKVQYTEDLLDAADIYDIAAPYFAKIV